MKSNELDLTDSKKLFSNILDVAVPLMLSGILQLLYNAADLIVCGKFGSTHSVAAIGSTNSLNGLCINFFIGLSVGSNIILAKHYSLNDKENGKKIINNSFIFSIFFGLLISICGFLLARTFLIWMDSPDDIIDLSTSYLQIIFLGAPFSLLYNFGAALLRATGDSKRPFIFLSLSGLLNVGLNLIFVIFLHLDVKGVAIATVISQIVSSILVWIAIRKNKGYIYFRLKELKFDHEEANNILKIGIPSGLQSLIFSFSNVMLQSSINSLGTLVMDGSGAASSLEGFVYTSMNAFSAASMPFISGNKAVSNKENIKKTIFYSMIFIFFVSIFISGIEGLFNEQLLSFYLKDNDAIYYGQMHLLSVLPVYFLCGYGEVFSFGQRSLGHSALPMIIACVSICGYRLFHIFVIFPIEKFHNIGSLMLSYPLSWLFALIAQVISFIIIFKKTFRNEKIRTLEL